jgi:hypothetical protein
MAEAEFAATESEEREAQNKLKELELELFFARACVLLDHGSAGEKDWRSGKAGPRKGRK